MKTKIYIMIILPILCLAATGIAQTLSDTTHRETKAPYYIDSYMVDPQTKTISILTRVGGVYWDGLAYQPLPDSIIKYDETTLIILGSKIFFKELWPVELDLPTLHVVNDRKEIYADKNILHKYSHWINDVMYKYKDAKEMAGAYAEMAEKLKHSIIDISGYTAINDYIYTNKAGDVYFLAEYAFRLGKVTGLPDLDLATLKHVVDGYFEDKNGYYFFSLDLDSEKIDKSKIPAYDYNSKENESIARNYEITVRNGRAYYAGYPVKEAIDVKKLERIVRNGKNTAYYTDGKSLIYPRPSLQGHDTQAVFNSETNSMIPYSDVSALKAVNERILADENYIYNGSDGISIVPIHRLGMDVKIIIE